MQGVIQKSVDHKGEPLHIEDVSDDFKEIKGGAEVKGNQLIFECFSN